MRSESDASSRLHGELSTVVIYTVSRHAYCPLRCSSSFVDRLLFTSNRALRSGCAPSSVNCDRRLTRRRRHDNGASRDTPANSSV